MLTKLNLMYRELKDDFSNKNRKSKAGNYINIFNPKVFH